MLRLLRLRMLLRRRSVTGMSGWGLLRVSTALMLLLFRMARGRGMPRRRRRRRRLLMLRRGPHLLVTSARRRSLLLFLLMLLRGVLFSQMLLFHHLTTFIFLHGRRIVGVGRRY